MRRTAENAVRIEGRAAEKEWGVNNTTVIKVRERDILEYTWVERVDKPRA